MLFDHGDPVNSKEFLFEKDSSGKWVDKMWNIICNYPPERSPTRAEEKEAIWKKEIPWPKLQAQLPLANFVPSQEIRTNDELALSIREPGTRGGSGLRPSDVSQIFDHYIKKASKDQKEAGGDAE